MYGIIIYAAKIEHNYKKSNLQAIFDKKKTCLIRQISKKKYVFAIFFWKSV